MKTVLNLILCHLTARETEERLQYFQDLLSPADCLLAYGGPRQEFAAINWPRKILVHDSRLVPGPDLQRNRQNYCGVIRAVSDWLNTSTPNSEPHAPPAQSAGAAYEFINFMEFDHLPLTAQYNRRVTERLQHHSADMLGYRLRRVDGTHSPLYLNHVNDPRFPQFLRDLTVRADPGVVLQTLGTGTFWRRAAFEHVARVEEPLPVYLELFLPSVAHHLGYRVVGMPEESNTFVRPNPLRPEMFSEARHRPDVLSLHPVKTPTQFQEVRRNVLP